MKSNPKNLMNIHLGDCVQIQDAQDVFQVIGIDDKHKRCWIRRWPLIPSGCPVFEIPLKQIVPPEELSAKYEVNSSLK